MSDLQLQPIPSFGDHRLTTIRFSSSSDEWWLVNDLATALEYADSKELARFVRGKWASEFTSSEVRSLEGAELANLRVAVDESYTASIHPKARSVTLVNRSGLYGILMLTRQPAGTAFRRWLRDVALPFLEQQSTRDREQRTLHLLLVTSPTEQRRTFSQAFYRLICRVYGWHVDSRPRYFAQVITRLYTAFNETLAGHLRARVGSTRDVRWFQWMRPETYNAFIGFLGAVAHIATKYVGDSFGFWEEVAAFARIDPLRLTADVEKTTPDDDRQQVFEFMNWLDGESSKQLGEDAA